MKPRHKRPEPLPPATRVFVSGTHPQASSWWYVTAFLDKRMLRGYVQGVRVNTDLPEPLAEPREVTAKAPPRATHARSSATRSLTATTFTSYAISARSPALTAISTRTWR